MVAVGFASFIGTSARTLHVVQDKEQRPENRQNAYEKSPKGVSAQEPPSTADEDGLIIDIWQFGLNVVGLVGLLFTVLYARGAWVAARDSSVADNEALTLTREAMIAERRPWIHISVEKASVLVGFEGEDFATLTFRLENLGRHPAIAVAISGEGVQPSEIYKLSVPERLIREDREMEAEIGGPIGLGITLFPGESAPVGRVFTVNRKAYSAAGLVAGYVTYRSTITDETHYTPWAFEVRYAPGEAEREVEATAIKFYLTTSPT